MCDVKKYEKLYQEIEKLKPEEKIYTNSRCKWSWKINSLRNVGRAKRNASHQYG